MPNRDRIKGRSIRIEDDLWDAAHAAAKINGEPVSAVIRRELRRYVRATAARQRKDAQGGGGTVPPPRGANRDT